MKATNSYCEDFCRLAFIRKGSKLRLLLRPILQIGMPFEVGTFLTAWLLAMSSDFLDASFLVTVSLTMYAPCCGWRDNENFFSLDRFLLFVGCSLALILRTVLLFNGVDPLRWDGICHIGAALILLVFFTEVLIKWRRAVYGRSQLGTTLGRRLPEEREGRRSRASAANASNSLEDGRRPLALDNGATLTLNSNQTNDNAPTASQISNTSTRKDYEFGCHWGFPAFQHGTRYPKMLLWSSVLYITLPFGWIIMALESPT